jgi:hypothetical protein
MDVDCKMMQRSTSSKRVILKTLNYSHNSELRDSNKIDKLIFDYPSEDIVSYAILGSKSASNV